MLWVWNNYKLVSRRQYFLQDYYALMHTAALSSSETVALVDSSDCSFLPWRFRIPGTFNQNYLLLPVLSLIMILKTHFPVAPYFQIGPPYLIPEPESLLSHGAMQITSRGMHHVRDLLLNEISVSCQPDSSPEEVIYDNTSFLKVSLETVMLQSMNLAANLLSNRDRSNKRKKNMPNSESRSLGCSRSSQGRGLQICCWASMTT